MSEPAFVVVTARLPGNTACVLVQQGVVSEKGVAS